MPAPSAPLRRTAPLWSNGFAASGEPRQSLLQRRHRTVDVLQLLEAGQAQPEGTKTRRLAALQRHSGRALQPQVAEFLAGSDVGVSGVADDHARRLVARGRNARKTSSFERRPHPLAELVLRFARPLEAQLPGLG